MRSPRHAGAVTGQANTPPTFPTTVMNYLRDGLTAHEALARALADEPQNVSSRFQVAVVDGGGRAAGFTARSSLRSGEGIAPATAAVAAATCSRRESVVAAVGEAFTRDPALPLDQRLLHGDEAGVAAGGDRRGHRCGYLRVVSPDRATNVEIRVHDHLSPLVELRRLRDVYRVEGDFVTLALTAAGAIKAIIPAEELESLSDRTLIDALAVLRDQLVVREAPAESLTAVDRLHGVLAARPEAAMPFGQVLRILQSVT